MRDTNDRGGREERDSEFIDRLVHINRVAKVVKGGRRFGFAALVVVGDQKGRVGFGHGKAREVPEAIRKATEQAKRQLIRVPLREARTLHHDVTGRHGAGKVVLRAAASGHRHHRRRSDARRVRDPRASTTSSPSRRAPRTPTTWSAPPSMRSSASTARVRSRPAAASRSPSCRPAAARPSKPKAEELEQWPTRPSPSSRSARPIRRQKDQRATLIGLGLNKIRKQSTLKDTPEVRGMINKLPHLVRVVGEKVREQCQ